MIGKTTKEQRLRKLRARTGDPDPLADRRARRERRERARLEAIRANDPAHDDTPADELDRLRAWVRENVTPSRKSWDSYGMKHAAERALGGRGYYVSNAALKGVMLEAGYEPVWDTGINMGFLCEESSK
jgi:hypothetical protein